MGSPNTHRGLPVSLFPTLQLYPTHYTSIFAATPLSAPLHLYLCHYTSICTTTQLVYLTQNSCFLNSISHAFQHPFFDSKPFISNFALQLMRKQEDKKKSEQTNNNNNNSKTKLL